MARYGKKAQKTVERAMRKRKHGTLRSGRSGKKVDQPKAGHRNRPLRGGPQGGEGAATRLERLAAEVRRGPVGDVEVVTP